MRDYLTIRLLNSGQTLCTPCGSTLEEIYAASGLEMTHGPVCAVVNNRVMGLDRHLYHDKDVRFLDMTHPAAARTYMHTLFMVCCRAIRDLWPGARAVIDTPVSGGYYVYVPTHDSLDARAVEAIRQRMAELIAADMAVERHRVPTQEAVDLFTQMGEHDTVKLLRSLGRLYSEYYSLGDYADYYYGALLPRTGHLYLFGLEPYGEGMLLRVPSRHDPTRLAEKTRQDKMFDIFREYHRWQYIMGLRTVADLGERAEQGMDTTVIHVGEALQEKKISHIADEIASREGLKLVLIAGPSSSGKTTTCKRLSIQMLAAGLRPIGISLDDYFVDRELTPRDESGEYDFESIGALNIGLINEQFNALFRGEEVELPRYNFLKGKSEWSGRRLRMGEHDLLVVEGIHALNPDLTAQIPEERKYRVYASALTTILLDNHNYIPTTDNRLLRRIIRDYKYRGVSARDTLKRWPSVRAGEERWIFPYQERADAMFNTSMIFELAVIRGQAEPLLEQVPENCEEYAEAQRLLRFLRFLRPIGEKDLPTTSLLREFLGGSSFEY